MRKEDFEKVKNYKDAPEGTWQKKLHDEYFLGLEAYLLKYGSEIKLDKWEYFTSKFVKPLFNGAPYSEYQNFLYQAKPSFYPDPVKLKIAWDLLKNDNRFDEELKRFFAFMIACDFLDKEWHISFERFLSIDNWMHPWYHEEYENNVSIVAILQYKYGVRFLKSQLVSAPWLNRK